VHKGSTQTNKILKIGFKYKGAKNRVCPGVAHRTVSGALGPYRVQTTTLGFLEALSTIIHRTVRCTSGVTAIQRNGRLQRLPTNATVRSSAGQSQSAPDTEQCLSGAAPDCPVPLEDKASNDRQLLNPNGWVMWLAHRTVSGGAPNCPVRPSAAATPNGLLVVEGHKYPQPPPLQASKFSEVLIQYKS
jgi:hypothetical protein